MVSALNFWEQRVVSGDRKPDKERKGRCSGVTYFRAIRPRQTTMVNGRGKVRLTSWGTRAEGTGKTTRGLFGKVHVTAGRQF